MLAGGALDWLATRRARPAPAPWVAMDFAVLAWLVASACATLAGVSPRLSVLGEIEQREGVMTTLALVGLYVGARRSHGGPEDVRHTLGVMLAAAALAATYAMIQSAGLDPLAWANPQTYSVGTTSALRPFGTLGNPILLGAVLAPALALAVTRLATRRGEAWWLVPLAALLAIGAVATLSRGVWLAAAAGVAAALGGALAAGATSRRRLAAATLAVLVPAALWGAFVLRAPLLGRLAEGSSAGATSNPARLEIARGALALWRAHPWLGTGPDTFGLTFPAVQTGAFWRNEWIGQPVHAHSVALQVLATCGVAGAIAGIAWLVTLALALRARVRAGAGEREGALAAGAACVALVVAGAINPVGLAGAACFGVLAALVATGAAAPRETPRAETAPRALAAGAGAVVALVLAAAAAFEVRALAAAGEARAELTQSTLAGAPRAPLLERAQLHAAQASVRAPGEDELWRLDCDAALATAAAALASGGADSAEAAARHGEDAARRAIELEPRRASNWQRLGNALAVRAQAGAPVAALADSADAAFASARRLAPTDALVLVDQCRGQLAMRRGERALESARRIVALYPEAATGHALEGAALLLLERREEARAALQRASAARWEEDAESQRRAVEDLLQKLAGDVPAR